MLIYVAEDVGLRGFVSSHACSYSIPFLVALISGLGLLSSVEASETSFYP